MAPFVVDASATLPWCFEDEATAWSESLLDLLSRGEQAYVPAHWLIEISNGLLTATRRQRIMPGRAELFGTSYRRCTLPSSHHSRLPKPNRCSL